MAVNDALYFYTCRLAGIQGFFFSFFYVGVSALVCVFSYVNKRFFV